MATQDESPRSADDRFYTPRASARTTSSGTGYSSGDDKFYTPRTGLTARSDGSYYTPRTDYSSSDNEHEEFYSSRDNTADGTLSAHPMPYAYGAQPPGAGVGMMPPGYGRSTSNHSTGVPPAYPRSTSTGSRSGSRGSYTIGADVSVQSFTVPSPKAVASPSAYAYPAYPEAAAVATAEYGGYTLPSADTEGKFSEAAYAQQRYTYQAYSAETYSSGKTAEAPERKLAPDTDVEAADYGVGPERSASTHGITEQDVQDVWSLTRHNKYKEVAALLEKGLPVNVRDKFGNTILATACQNGLKRIAKIALRGGADINARNNKGNTPLHFCFAFGYGDTLGAYLISKGADPTIRNTDGLTCREGLGGMKTPRR